MAQEILSLGLSVVLDFGLWARIERDEMRTAARALGVGVELHYLIVPNDELWRRIEARNSAPPWDNEPIGRADLDEWLTGLRPSPTRRCRGRTHAGHARGTGWGEAPGVPGPRAPAERCCWCGV